MWKPFDPNMEIPGADFASSWLASAVVGAPAAIVALAYFRDTPDQAPAVAPACAWLLGASIAPMASGFWHRRMKSYGWTAISNHILIGGIVGFLWSIFIGENALREADAAIILAAGPRGGAAAAALWWILRRPDQDTPPPATSDNDESDDETEATDSDTPKAS